MGLLEAIGLKKRQQVTSASTAQQPQPAAPQPQPQPQQPAPTMQGGAQALGGASQQNEALNQLKAAGYKDGGVIDKKLLRQKALVKQKRGC